MTTSVFNRIAIIGRRRVDGIAETVNNLVAFLQQHQVKVVLDDKTAEWLDLPELESISHDQLNNHADLIIVVGGDGSLLNAARIAAEQDLPVLGINRGTLGFLTDIGPDQLDSITEILHGHYIQEDRFLLQLTLPDGTTTTALNDVVLQPGHSAKMISFEVYVNDKLAYTLRSDGLIVATPTGSTAYSLSGGGPIVQPGLDAMILVPISPHTLSNRSIVINGNCTVSVKVSDKNVEQPEVSCDGQICAVLKPNEQYQVCQYNKRFKLIHRTDYDYYSTLRNKLHWKG